MRGRRQADAASERTDSGADTMITFGDRFFQVERDILMERLFGQPVLGDGRRGNGPGRQHRVDALRGDVLDQGDQFRFKII